MLESTKNIFSKHKTLLLSFVFFFVFSGVLSVFAAAPSGGYAPNATLDPDCAPGDTDCIVDPYANLDPNSVLYLDGSGEITTDTNFVRNGEEFFVGGEVVVDTISGFRIGDIALPALFGGGVLPGVGLEMISDEFHHALGLSENGFAILTEDTLAGTGGNFIMDSLGVDFTFLMPNDVSSNFGSTSTGIAFQWLENNDRYQLRLNNTGLQYIFGWNGSAPEDYYIFPNSVAGAGQVLTDVNGNGTLSWETPSGGGLTIGDTVTNGTINRMLFIDSAGDLADITSDNMRIEVEAEDDITAYVNNSFGGRFRVRDTLSTNSGLTVRPGINGTLLEIDDDTNLISGTAMFSGYGSNLYVNSMQNYLTWTDGVDTWGFGSDSGSSGQAVIYGGSTIYHWPSSVGSNGDVLTLGAAGVLSWETPSGGSVTVDGLSNVYTSTIDAGNPSMTGGNNIFMGNLSGTANTSGSHNIFNGYGSGRSNEGGSYNIFSGNQSGFSNTTGNNNIFNGQYSGYSNTTGSQNLFMGMYSGFENIDGINNVFLGSYGGRYIRSSNNTAIGYEALQGSIVPGDNTGPNNTVIGYQAGRANTSGTSNFFGGYQSGFNNTTGAFNTFIGSGAGQLNSTASYNVFIGGQAGQTNSTGTQNTFVGGNAGQNNSIGVGNSFFGSGTGMSSTGDYNTFLGVNAGYSNTTGGYNIFLGPNSGYANTSGMSNIFIGENSGDSNLTGVGNIFQGAYAGASNTTGRYNVFTGHNAGISSTEGWNNIFSGFFAGYYNTTGSNNIAIGEEAGYENFTGANNISLGYRAGYSNTVSSNIFIGRQAGYSNTTGASNIFNGLNSGYNNTTGSSNIFIGENSGDSNTTGANNIFLGLYAGDEYTTGGASVIIGSGAGNNLTTGDYNTVIGYQTSGTAGVASSIVLGAYGTVTANNQFVVGSNESPINTMYVGNGVTNSTPTAFILNATGATDNDETGANLILAGGKGRGDSVVGGSILFQTSDIAADTVLQSLSTKMEIQGDGGVFMYNLASGTGGGGYDAVCIDATTEELTINTGGDDCVVSSARFKENITNLDLGLSFINSLTPRTFNYLGTSDQRIGFIAEEVVQVDARLVFYEDDSVTVRGVRYQDITAALTKAIQEMDIKLIGIQTLSDETFLSRMRNWFADAGNGIQKIFTKEIQTEKICIGTGSNIECIESAEELRAIKASLNINYNNQIIVPSPQENEIIEQESNLESETIVEEPPTEETIEEPVEEVIVEESPVIEEPQPIIEPTPVVEETPQTE